MIRKLYKEDIDNAFMIIKSVIIKMNVENIQQWDDIYPNANIIANDVLSGSAYGYFDKKELCGYVCINEEFPADYLNVSWNDKTGKSLMVHRLSVKPAFQGCGIAKTMMVFIENNALQRGFSSVRLDAFIYNQAALRLYENMGYNKVGQVQFRKGFFNCYEKIIS